MIPQERFWRWTMKTPGGCWRWTGVPGSHGYGTISINAKTRLAHRVSYELWVGPIPKGMQVDHLCRNKRCVNPLHMEVVTHRVNTNRGDTISTRNKRKTKCVNGHPYTPENTYRRPDDGSRGCLTCRRERNAARDRRKGGAR